MNHYQETIPEVAADLHTSTVNGLTGEEVKSRQKIHGPNSLPHAGAQITRIGIFARQWKSPLLIILVVAGIISLALHDYTDAAIILFTAAFNAFIGFIQEDKANQSLSKLREMISYKSPVIRDHAIRVVDTSLGFG